jgi:hypothetical protein
MKSFNLGSYALSGGVAVALIAGCSGSQPPISARGAMPEIPAMATHAHRSTSWMLKDPSQKSILVYAGNWSTNDVEVYDYPSGTQVGTLTGFHEPYGGCVDTKGDVYITNFGNGTAVEYAHGGTTILNTYSPGDEPIGCSVDKQGDVAITSFSPGEVTVYDGGNSSDGKTYSNSSCSYQWPMGYDDVGNLIGQGDSGIYIRICALLAGAKSETTLSVAGGISLEGPGGTMWDGKYIALAQPLATRSHKTLIMEATLAGSVLTVHGETYLAGHCGPEDDVDPFILGKKNTPINDRQGEVVVGATPSCTRSVAGISSWHYPNHHKPYGTFGTSSYSVSAVSIK